MLNPDDRRVDSNTQKQVKLLARAEELMAAARQSFQRISQRPKHDDFTQEINRILAQCERAAQIVDRIPPREVQPERLHMTQSVKNSITSQTVFYQKWIADYMDAHDRARPPSRSDPPRVSFKLLLARLCQSERNLASAYEQHKRSEGFGGVLETYRRLLFALIDFFEGHIASRHDWESRHAPGQGERHQGRSRRCCFWPTTAWDAGFWSGSRTASGPRTRAWSRRSTKSSRSEWCCRSRRASAGRT